MLESSDLNGIISENDFFTDQYLQTAVENDLADIFARWRKDKKEKTCKTPVQGLQDCALPWRTLMANKEASTDDFYEFARSLLTALGYQDNLCTKDTYREVKSGWIPVAGELCASNKAPYLWILTYLDNTESEQGTSAEDPRTYPFYLYHNFVAVRRYTWQSNAT